MNVSAFFFSYLQKARQGLMHFFSSQFCCWWPLTLLLPLSCVWISGPSWKKFLLHIAVYFNMLLVKAGLYFFFCWAFGYPVAFWAMLDIEFVGGLLNLEDSLIIWSATKKQTPTRRTFMNMLLSTSRSHFEIISSSEVFLRNKLPCVVV